MRCLTSLLLIGFCFLSSGCSRAQEETPQAAAPPPPVVKTALDEYIARPEPQYAWKKSSERRIGNNDVTTLDVTSQVWQGAPWTNRVEIVRPAKNQFPNWALVYLSTTNGVMESMLTQSLAGQLGATVIHVMGIPNQPLYGMREDDLIAHTFSKYLETGDDTWPLLLPMTKSVVKSLDAVQEYSQENGAPLEKFVVTGASKRGWTTWLVAAADTKDRIGGIIPMVYDNLNLEKQMPHQLESWGKYSPMIEDYTRRGLQQQMETPQGKVLSAVVDPYTYRERFTMPKLIVNGTNDPYWTLDALNLYWNDLPEPKNVYYAPNSGHSLENDLQNVIGTTVGWFRRVAGGTGIPSVEISSPKALSGTGYAATGFNVTVKTKERIVVKRYWSAASSTKDFRNAEWREFKAGLAALRNRGPADYTNPFESGNIVVLNHDLIIEHEQESPKYRAVVVEFVFGKGSESLRVSSPIVIWEPQNARVSEP